MGKKNMKIFVVSAFSKGNTGGNKAGVCLLGEGLTKSQKMKISKKLGYAETAFVSTATINGATFKLEYFTPSEEVPLCGHATIGAFAVMREKLPLEKDSYVIQTKEANLQIKFEEKEIFMEQNKPTFGEILETQDIEKCFNIDVINADFPIQIVSTGLWDIMLPVKDEETLNLMIPNFEEISNISRKYETVGIHAFVINKDRIICRNFAPLYDVPEESATGTSNCALSCYLYHHNIIRSDEYKIEQGYSLNSPSEITVKLETENNEIQKVLVGGTAYICDEINVKVE